MPLLKSLHPIHLKDYLDGALRFQPLTYFRQQHEAAGVGDSTEGSREYAPSDGLILQTANGDLRTDLTFVPRISDTDFFVHCLSRPPMDWAGLDYSACVEIVDAQAFTRRIEAAVNRQFPEMRVVQRRVFYYERSAPHGTVWADPTAIAFSKPATYSQQREFRCVFARNELFKSGRTTQDLVRGAPRPPKEVPPLRLVDVGDIRDIAREHHRAG